MWLIMHGCGNGKARGRQGPWQGPCPAFGGSFAMLPASFVGASMTPSRFREQPVSRRDLSLMEMCPPIFQQCYAWATLHPVLIGTVLLHHSLGLWTIYQGILGFRPSYRMSVELLFIATHVIRNLYAMLHGWGTHLDGGQIFISHQVVNWGDSIIATILSDTGPPRMRSRSLSIS